MRLCIKVLKQPGQWSFLYWLW